MPTAYTADVADGKITDLRSFALQCARGMGALIMMRDEPWDAPIPERFEPGTYNAERLAEAKELRQHLYNMTNSEADEDAKAEFEEKAAAKAKWLADKAERRARYNAMLAQVEQWEGPPEGLKEFMLDQLRIGRDGDCPDNDRYYDEPVALTGSEWRRLKLEKVADDIQYHAAENAKERERTESRNGWIARLRASLPSEQRADAP